MGVTEILFSFRLVLEGKTGKEIPDSSRLEFLLRKRFSKQLRQAISALFLAKMSAFKVIRHLYQLLG